MSGRIDVTELMSDPDFVGPILHISRLSQANGSGENIITECKAKTVGSVQPISGREIQRIPEAQRVANMMTFWIKGKIIASAPGKYSDILVFEGSRFQVLTVDDWSAWGEGWCQGMCVDQRPS